MSRDQPETAGPVALSPKSARAFILANTRRLTPPLVPEIGLHLAEESLPIWQKTEEELGAINVPPPYWAFAWAGGQALARYVLDHAGLVAGQRVLDLGSGSGLSAIAAAKSGAASVLAAETDAFACEAIAINAEGNGCRIETVRRDLLADGADAPDAGVVLVGDLFYEQELARRVLAFATAARSRGAAVLVGDPQRSYFPADRFTKVADYAVPVTRELEDALIKRTAVWTLG